MQFDRKLRRRPGRHRKKNCCGCCHLTEASCGKVLRVRSLEGDDNFNAKMIEQGVFPGSVITLIAGNKNNPCLFMVGDSRIMLDSSSAELIYVIPA